VLLSGKAFFDEHFSLFQKFCYFKQKLRYIHAQIGTSWVLRMGYIRVLGIGLEQACNGGSCGGISLKRDKFHLHLKRLPALASLAS